MFTFKKKGVLFKRPKGMPKPGPYYPCLVKMEDIQDFPFEFALYFSTDHSRDNGGIWIYLCNGIPTEAKNWKSYDQAVKDGDFDYLINKPKKNPIFVDKKRGKHHTETPHVNIINRTAYMSYHKGFLGQQMTLLATSKDGINFNKLKDSEDSIILPSKPNGGHTGYFRWAPNPFPKINYSFIGYSLHGGGNNYHSALWGSNDAIDWKKLNIFTPKEGFAMDQEDMIMIWHEINPNVVKKINDNEYILISAGGNRASGGTRRIVEIYEIYLADDGMTLTRKCRKIIPQGPKGSLDDEEVAEPTMVKIEDRYHLIYIGTTKKARRNTVMAAVGEFNPNAELSERL